MSRNLATSKCEKCFHKFTLSDFRGKPIEFRRYGPYPPVMGCRVDCECGAVYFAYIRTLDKFWDKGSLTSGEWNNGTRDKSVDGRFARETYYGIEDTGCYTIDLSYYDSYNDEEGDGNMDNPSHLCTDNAEDAEWVWEI